MDVSGKVFVVTGAGDGIGRQVALLLLAKGARVAGVDLRREGLAETARISGVGARFSQHVVDITDRDAVAALPAAVQEVHASVDGLVNVAGVIQQFVRVVDLPFSEIERVMDVNFWGTMNTCKAFLPVLLERPQASLVNIASMGAFAPVPGQAVYSASKAAVRLLTEALYAELMNTGVSVGIVFPGSIRTNIAANSGVAVLAGTAETAKYPMTSPEVAARVIVDVIEKGRFRATIGRDSAMMDILSRLNPRLAAVTIAKQMGALLG